MSRKDDEATWGMVVLVAVIFLAVIAIFKALFWISLGMIGFGMIWLILDRESDYTFIPVIMIIVGVILAPISYAIGYYFPSTNIGSDLVDTATTIVEADETIAGAEENATNEIVGALENLP